VTVKAHVQLEADGFDGCALSYQIGGSWLYAAGVSVVRGDELVGSAPPPIPGGPSSTWKLVRN
jgi:hypothetical protein